MCPTVDAIALGDRRRVELGERASGGSKNGTRFGQIGQQRVVVKIQGAHGRITEEERTLRFLATHGVRVPEVIDSGNTPKGDRFLVISREEGARTITPEGWSRFGRSLATLLDVPTSGCPFTQVTTPEFVADHQERLDLVRTLVTDDLAHEIENAIIQIAAVDRLVVTHGDPGKLSRQRDRRRDSPGLGDRVRFAVRT